MKTFRLISMAALALTLAACSNDDMEVITEQPKAPTGGIPFTATISTAGAATRALSEGKDGSNHDILNADWEVNEQVALVYEVGGTTKVSTATVTEVTSGTATITATLDENVTNGTAVTLRYPAASVSTTDGNFDNGALQTQQGSLPYISNMLDFREGTGTITLATTPASLRENVTMGTSQVAVWKLALQEGSSPLSVRQLTVKQGSNVVAKTEEFSGTGASELYIALPPTGGSTSYTFETSDGTSIYKFTTANNVTLAANTYYQSTLSLTKFVKNTDLSTLTANYTAENGETLTGTLGAYKLSIADGAQVTLSGVTIGGTEYASNTSCRWAGITCLGDATIILADNTTNNVKAFYHDFPGIICPKDKTLTIRGNGTLNASSNSYTSGYNTNGSAAGIGGGYGTSSGSAYSCGNIVIDGGTVNATCAGKNAAGIGAGGGQYGTCGNITITANVTKVTATKGTCSNSGWTLHSIGPGYDPYNTNKRNVSCGTVTIGGVVYWQNGEYINGGDYYLSFSPYEYNPGAIKSLSDGVTSDDIGRVIAADGKIYATAGSASNKGITPLAMIAYVGTAPAGGSGAATCQRGLAIALNSIQGKNHFSWDTSEANNNGKTAAQWFSDWASTHNVSLGTWRLPTIDDCKYILQGCGGTEYSTSTVSGEKLSYGSLQNKFFDCGAEGISFGYTWWTSNEDGNIYVWALTFYDNAYSPYCHFHTLNKNVKGTVRPVLAF